MNRHIMNASTGRIERLYSQQEVADLFGVHVSTIWRWRKAGVIGAKKIGGKVLFTLDEINRTIKENQEKGASNEES